MACFAPPYGLRYAAHCFNRADAQNNRPALIPATEKLGVTSLAQTLQHHPAAQLARLSPASPENGDTAMAALRFRFAPPAARHDTGGNLALTINTDRS